MKKLLAALVFVSVSAAAQEIPKFERIDALELDNAQLRIQSLDRQLKEQVAIRDGVFKKYGYHVTPDGHVVKDPVAVKAPTLLERATAALKGKK